MTASYYDKLYEFLRNSHGADWLEGAVMRLESTDSLLDELVLLSAMARRKLGDDKLPPHACPINTPHGALDAQRLHRADAGRITLVLKAMEMGSVPVETLVADMFRLGDEYEKAAIIKGLVLFSDSDSLKSVALECGRTNSLLLFECLAVGNPYAAAFYTEQEYNQLVLKALFIGVNTDGIVGLDRRANRELSRMCENYVDERLAAGRDVPADIWLPLAPHASPTGKQRLLEFAGNDDRSQRYYALRAILGILPDNPGLVELLNERLARETDEELAGMLRNLPV